MSKKPISKDSQTDWERLEAVQDEDIDLSDIPEITEALRTSIRGRDIETILRRVIRKEVCAMETM